MFFKRIKLLIVSMSIIFMLLACSSEVEVTITFNSNGGSDIDPIVFDSKSDFTMPDNPSKEGYLFQGWFFDNQTFAEPFTVNSMTENEIKNNFTVYAKWIIDEDYIPSGFLRVMFNSMGGTEISHVFVRSGELISEPNVTKTGYTFEGWYTSSNQGVTLSDLWSFSTQTVDQNVELFAKWTLNIYSITYVLDGGNNHFLNPAQYTVNISFDIFSPTKAGYTFEGWFLNSSFSGNPITSLTTGSTGNITLYAKWSINSYTIRYEIANGLTLSGIPFNANESIMKIASGAYFSAALTTEGRLLTWGSNGYGQLGNQTLVSQSVPVDITNHFNLLPEETILDVSLGGYHSAALTSGGRIFTWGFNNYGQLGDGTTVNQNTPVDTTAYFNLMGEETIIDIELGWFHSMALTSNGRLLMWGSNGSGRLGDGTTIHKNTPLDITSQFNLTVGESIVKISAGEEHSSALSSSGRIFTWGRNAQGQLGDNTTTLKTSPVNITSLFTLNEGETIVDISLGDHHTSALTSHGRMFIWGNNEWGQLGDGTLTYRKIPIDITARFNLIAEDHITHISLGGYHSAAVTLKGFVYTWGKNVFGQLGDDISDGLTPKNIQSHLNLSTTEIIESVALGGDHSLLLTSDGQLLSWGDNGLGQLGNGSNLISSTPIPLVTEGFEVVITITYAFGQLTSYIPTKEGFTFDGWYRDQAFTIPYTHTTMQTEDITLYGRWENEYPKATTLIIHYVRTLGDYDGWNIWLWPSEPTSSSGQGYLFTEDDQHGKVLTIHLAETSLVNSTLIGFVVRKGEWVEKDVEYDRFIDMTKPNEQGQVIVYIYQGDSTIYTENQST
jgi:uncharacterized repeat protein (TIGR02543 family)